jgi:hypothetical protein
MSAATDLPTAVLRSVMDLAEWSGERLIGFKVIADDGDDPTRWVASGWIVITQVGYYEFNNDGICYRSAVLHPFTDAWSTYLAGLAPDERCPSCGQPDNTGDCNHAPINDPLERAQIMGTA